MTYNSRYPDLTDVTPRVALIVTLDFIHDNPERHDQDVWMMDEEDWKNPHSCGTSACVAGWGALFAGYRPVRDNGYMVSLPDSEDTIPVPFAAADVFGLDSETADWLFEAYRTTDELEYVRQTLRAGGTVQDAILNIVLV